MQINKFIEQYRRGLSPLWGKKILCLYILVIGFSCNFPKDSKDSYLKAKNKALIVGIVDNPPFTIYTTDSVSGTEVDLIEKFAAQEGLEVDYRRGTESTLIKELEEYRIHLLIGGFEKNTVWKNKAGVSKPYNDKNIMLIAKGENKLLYKLEAVLLKQKENGN